MESLLLASSDWISGVLSLVGDVSGTGVLSLVGDVSGTGVLSLVGDVSGTDLSLEWSSVESW